MKKILLALVAVCGMIVVSCKSDGQKSDDEKKSGDKKEVVDRQEDAEGSEISDEQKVLDCRDKFISLVKEHDKAYMADDTVRMKKLQLEMGKLNLEVEEIALNNPDAYERAMKKIQKEEEEFEKLQETDEYKLLNLNHQMDSLSAEIKKATMKENGLNVEHMSQELERCSRDFVEIAENNPEAARKAAEMIAEDAENE